MDLCPNSPAIFLQQVILLYTFHNCVMPQPFGCEILLSREYWHNWTFAVSTHPKVELPDIHFDKELVNRHKNKLWSRQICQKNPSCVEASSCWNVSFSNPTKMRQNIWELFLCGQQKSKNINLNEIWNDLVSVSTRKKMLLSAERLIYILGLFLFPTSAFKRKKVHSCLLLQESTQAL